MEEILGYISAAFIGLSLRLFWRWWLLFAEFPVLIYLFHLNPGIATSYSLFVVGSTSLVGSVTYYKNGFVQLKTALHLVFPHCYHFIGKAICFAFNSS